MSKGEAWAPKPWPEDNPAAVTDLVARDAAQLVHSGRVESVQDAINIALDLHHAEPRDRPGKGLVRRHLQAMTMQAIGEEAYRARIRRVHEVAEQAMTAIDLAFDDIECELTGRAAQGHIDGGVTVTIRLHTDRSIDDVEARLEELGYEELRTGTVSTRYGRMNQLHAMDDEQPILFTRVPPGMRVNRAESLFKEKRMTTMSLEQLRSQLSSME